MRHNWGLYWGIFSFCVNSSGYRNVYGLFIRNAIYLCGASGCDDGHNLYGAAIMPSTITAFYTFVAGTKAKSSDMNTNFSAFRGHLLPIDPTAGSAANNAYDLGSTEYRWKNAYIGGLNVAGPTTTSNLTIVRDTATSAAEFIVAVGGSEAGRIYSDRMLSRAYYTISAATGMSTFTTLSNYITWTSSFICRGNPVEVFLIKDNTSAAAFEMTSTGGAGATASVTFICYVDASAYTETAWTQFSVAGDTTASYGVTVDPNIMRLTLLGITAGSHSISMSVRGSNSMIRYIRFGIREL